jgi:hypothetical protein
MARQYINKAGQVRWFAGEAPAIEIGGVIWSRIPTYAKVKSQLAYASEAAGEEVNVENSDIGVAVPDGKGGYERVVVQYNHDLGEWEGVG